MILNVFTRYGQALVKAVSSVERPYNALKVNYTHLLILIYFNHLEQLEGKLEKVLFSDPPAQTVLKILVDFTYFNTF